MRGFLLFLFSFLLVCNVHSQKFSAKDFLFASSLSSKKLDNYLSKNRFLPSGSRVQNGTLVSMYMYRSKPTKKKKDTVNILRTIETFHTKNNFSFTYITSLKSEFDVSLRTLKESGFFCGNEKDSTGLFFQKKNISVLANMIREKDNDTLYSLAINQQELPLPENIQFAEDLLQFYSHEYLVSVFGEANVIKDLYYFSEKDVAKCSVLFPKSSRQAVFIWEDDINLCKPSYVIIGGNMNTNTISNYDGVIGENVWNSKEGIYSGMSLNSLIRLNGSSFKFYGKNSTSPYMIVPENTGILNFKTNRVILGCLNPSGSRLLNNPMISADEILSDNLGIYVHMMMILPGPAHK